MIPLAPNETTLPKVESTAAKDGVEAILEHHQHVRNLFASYRQLCASNGDRSVKLTVVKNTVKQIASHASAKEQTLYPLAKAKISAASKLLHGILLINDQTAKIQWQFVHDHLPTATSTDEEWALFDRQVDLAATLVEMQMGVEEEEVLAKLRIQCSIPEREKLWMDWSRTMRVTPPLQPHPSGPNRPLLASVVHPFEGALDRAKDAAGHALERLHLKEEPASSAVAAEKAAAKGKGG